jgi:hypothetical protein
MLVKITCNPKDVQATLEYYEAQDLHLIERRVLNREATELIFETSGKERAFTGDNVETFLEFQDGSVSPLHIRKDRDWAE